MAHDTEFQAKLDRFDTLINQLEAGHLSVTEVEQLHEEGLHLLDEVRMFITDEDGEVIRREG